MAIRRQALVRLAPVRSGFVLPLSITGALVLLLSSLSLQTVMLHGRTVQAAERARLQAEDQLASAAQQLAAHWQAGRDPEAALPLTLAGQSIELRRWQPDGQGGGALRLAVAGSGLQRSFLLGGAGVRELGR
mgnify:CR=1 FL=1